MAFYTEDECFLQAKREELAKWKSFNVYKEDEDNNQNRFTSRWVCTEKSTPNGIKAEARFVVPGFQEKSSILKDLPARSKECLRLLLAVIAKRDGLCIQLT